MSGTLDAATLRARSIGLQTWGDGSKAYPLGIRLVDHYVNCYELVTSIDTAAFFNQAQRNTRHHYGSGYVARIYNNDQQCHQWTPEGTCYVADASGASALAADPTKLPLPPPAPGSAFHVSAGQILDPTGKVFRARGVNVSYTRLWGDGKVDLTRCTGPMLRRTFPGINFVRFANWNGALSDPADPTVAGWVADLALNGIVVEVELHYTGNAIAPNDPIACAWLARWAKAYANNPMIWYGLQNEPHGSRIAAMQAGLYAAVRSAGATAPVLLCCGNPNENVGLDKSVYAAMTNVAFDMHYYGWMVDKGYSWSSICATLAQYTSQDGVLPVLCLETGDSTDGRVRDANYRVVLGESLANKAGFAAWFMNWNVTGEADRLLAAPDGSALTDYGQMVRTAIQVG
jgi:Cellulase (glycosyl hydrolase family 5)